MGRFDSIFAGKKSFSDLDDFAERAADIFYKVITSPEGTKINVDGLEGNLELIEGRRENEGLKVLDYKDYLVFFGRKGRNTIITRLSEQGDLGRNANVNRASLQFALAGQYDSKYNPRKLLQGELDDKEMIIRNSLKAQDICSISASEFWDSYWYSAGKAVYLMIMGSPKVT